MRVLHLTSSRFFGGPERQMLGMGEAIKPDVQSVFASFHEEGLNRAFLDRVRDAGFTALAVQHDTPHLWKARKEIVDWIGHYQIDVLICHGYKAGTVGWFAARRAGIPAVAVSRGWTGESRRVRFYEALDRYMLRRMHRVICVSQAQADKVILSGVSADRVAVIHNSICPDRYSQVEPGDRDRLLEFFAPSARSGLRYLVAAAGRLSPEKGFALLVDAASKTLRQHADVGFLLFGEGPLRQSLQSAIDRHGIGSRFVLAGFSEHLDRWMPHFDLFVQSSHTEGLPNVLLEALAASVPVVATDVGGTREIVAEGLRGCRLVPARSVEGLHRAIAQSVSEGTTLENRHSLREHVTKQFAFTVQAARYQQELSRICGVATAEAPPAASQQRRLQTAVHE